MTNPAVSTLEDAILDPEPIELPPQRRLLIILMLVLTAFLHVATIGWGPIENGNAGFNAAVSRELAMGMGYQDISQNWGETIRPDPVQWLTALSFQMFSINEWAARLPIALANLLIVWMVFLAGEKMGGMWRGLASGIVAATTTGVILHGRDNGGASLTALLFIIAFYAVLRMLKQKSRLRWQVLFWISIGLLLLIDKPLAAIISLAGSLVAMIFFREARIRLKARWFLCLSMVSLILAGRVFFAQQNETSVPGEFWTTGFPAIGWLFFPWSVILVLPFLAQIRRVLRWSRFGVEDAAFWCSTAACVAASVAIRSPIAWSENVACLWPMFALVAGVTWERTTAGWRAVGISIFIVLALVGMTFCDRVVDLERLHLLRPVLWMSCGVLVVFGISAIVSIRLRHSRAAFLTIAASVVPLAFNLLDAESRYNWQHSMKNLGNKLAGDYQAPSPIYVDEEPREISSFIFYAPHGIRVVQDGKLSANGNSAGDYYLFRRTPSGLPPVEIVGRNGTHTLARLRKP